MIWTQPKQIGPVQNNSCSTKMIWTVQNYFGPTEGQGISILGSIGVYYFYASLSEIEFRFGKSAISSKHCMMFHLWTLQ